MGFDYKKDLLLQAIFPNKRTTKFVVKESYLGIKPLSAIVRDLVLSETKKAN